MAIIVAVLYFGLIELLMIDSSRELAQARQFRARIVATTLAENAAERASSQMAAMPAVFTKGEDEDAEGKISWSIQKMGSPCPPEQAECVSTFDIHGEGVTGGVVRTRATVFLRGTVVNGSAIYIDYSTHTP